MFTFKRFQDSSNKQLIDAVEQNNLAEVKKLLETQTLFRPKADIHAGYMEYTTPLMIAMRKGYKDIADYLNTYKDAFYGTVKMAVDTGYTETLDFLYQNKDINEPLRESGEALIHIVARVTGHDNMIGYAIEKGADVNAVMWDSEKHRNVTPLDIASSYPSYRIEQAGGKHAYDLKSDDKKKPIPTQSTGDWQKMTPKELERELTTNDSLLQKLIITGALTKAFDVFSYEQSMDIYKEISPKLDKKTQNSVEMIIRDKREQR